MAIKRLAVIGAGTMGSGIAQCCAMAGLPVVMVDIDDAAIQRGMDNIRSSLERLSRKGQLTTDKQHEVLALITGAPQLSQIRDFDLVIEAATENEAIKARLLKDIDDLLREEAIIATNTSSISITKLAAATSRPDRFIGMHFFNPVPMMALVELIRGVRTSDDTHARVEALSRQLGKTPIAARNSPGFAVNRILCPMINEAIFALGEGLATAEDIDNGMKLGCSHPIGPLALADLIGLDTLLSVLQVFYEGFADPKYRPAPLLKELVAAGYLGRKSGRGFYIY